MKRIWVAFVCLCACGGGGKGSGDAGIIATGTTNDASSSSPDAKVSAPSGGLFTAAEPWTEDVSSLQPASQSSDIITALKNAGGWGQSNTIQVDFSIPLFFADASTPTQTITAASDYCYGGPDCDSVPLTMPVPANGNIEGSTSFVCNTSENDCHLLVADTSAKLLYELYNATKSGNAFTALGAFVWHLDQAYPANERGDQCTSADAAGFPIAGLLVTADEVASGTVAHAVRFILPNDRMRKNVYVHPASHAGSPSNTDANAPPYGVRFRLKSSTDLSSYSANAQVVLKALQTYGMLLSDGGNLAFTFADDRTTTAKWNTLGITSTTFGKLTVDDFEVVDFSTPITVTDNCVRN